VLNFEADSSSFCENTPL